MLHIRKVLGVFLTALLLVQPVFAETEAATQPAEPDILVAVHSAATLPSDLSPLIPQTEENQWLRQLTTAPLYALQDDGSWEPVLADALPEDVTADYAGTYGIPDCAERGYGFRIRLRSDARWEDGSFITADDCVFSIRKLFSHRQTAQDWLFLSNAPSIRAGKPAQGTDIVSLRDAGYASLREAWSDGYKEFFVDTEGFWGLGGGWRSVSDRTRLRDFAMPGGLDEYFVTPAYLYRYYLMDGAISSYDQSQFIGICRTPGDALTIDDLGVIRVSNQELVLILQEPSTASTLMQYLESFFLFRSSRRSGADDTTVNYFQSYGPYRICSVSEAEILLEPNPNWWGAEDSRGYDRILCQKIGS